MLYGPDANQFYFAGEQGDALVAVMPLYLKGHSYGEYVFDWAWADAYHRNGLDYYPKLLTGVPYTPVTGPRLLKPARSPLELCAPMLKTAS